MYIFRVHYSANIDSRKTIKIEAQIPEFHLFLLTFESPIFHLKQSHTLSFMLSKAFFTLMIT